MSPTRQPDSVSDAKLCEGEPKFLFEAGAPELVKDDQRCHIEGLYRTVAFDGGMAGKLFKGILRAFQNKVNLAIRQPRPGLGERRFDARGRRTQGRPAFLFKFHGDGAPVIGRPCSQD